jgi:hypothetical protein
MDYKSAVEWYFKQMQSKEKFTQDEFDSIFEQAKEMEKQQNIDFVNWCNSEDAEDLILDLIIIGE